MPVPALCNAGDEDMQEDQGKGYHGGHDGGGDAQKGKGKGKQRRQGPQGWLERMSKLVEFTARRQRIPYAPPPLLEAAPAEKA